MVYQGGMCPKCKGEVIQEDGLTWCGLCGMEFESKGDRGDEDDTEYN